MKHFEYILEGPDFWYVDFWLSCLMHINLIIYLYVILTEKYLMLLIESRIKASVQ